MIPVGYMYKNVVEEPDWLHSAGVKDLYSVCDCFSTDFLDWIPHWQHNGYWFFDSPTVMQTLAERENTALRGMTLFFYFVHNQQWDSSENQWTDVLPDADLKTNVLLPVYSTRAGFDVVSYSAQTSAECSPLSCNLLAEELPVNSHCLLETFEEAKSALEQGRFENSEPGPYRILEVHTVQNDWVSECLIVENDVAEGE